MQARTRTRTSSPRWRPKELALTPISSLARVGLALQTLLLRFCVTLLTLLILLHCYSNGKIQDCAHADQGFRFQVRVLLIYAEDVLSRGAISGSGHLARGRR